MNSKFLLPFLLVLAGLLLSVPPVPAQENGDLGNSAPEGGTTPQENPPEVDRPQAGEFVVAYTARQITLDPLHIYTTMESELSTALYEGLVIPHPYTMEPMPGVAREWKVSEGGLRYTFTLRSDALYSNGDPVTAQDFRNSWLRYLDPAAKAEYSFLFDIIKGARAVRQGASPDQFGVKAVSDQVLEVELEKPASQFLKILTHLSFVPIHPRYLERTGWDRDASIVGNGPFYIVRRSPEGLVLRRNELYWDHENVPLEQIRIRFMEDTARISDEFNLGWIHWADNWDTSRLQDTQRIVFNPMFATSYFYFVSAEKPWNDARVRRALALLLPWDKIRAGERLFETSSLIPPFSEYPEVEGIKAADPKRAMTLLAEAGYPEGQGLPPLVFKVSSGSDAEQTAVTMAKAWHDAVGLEVKLRSYDYEDYMQEVKKSDYTIGSVTWIGDYADPLTFLQMWTRDSNLNDARYYDPRYESLIDDSMSQAGEERYKTLAEAEKILLDDAVVLPINHAPAFNLIDLRRIGGWYPNVLNVHPFKYIRFKEDSLPPGVTLARLADPARR